MQENEITFSPKSSGCRRAQRKLSQRLDLHHRVGQGAGVGFFFFFLAVVYLISTTLCVKSRRSNQTSGAFFTAQGMSYSQAETIKLQSTALAKQKLSLKHPDGGKCREQQWLSRDGAEPAEKAALPAQEVFCLCVNTGRLSSGPAKKVILLFLPYQTPRIPSLPAPASARQPPPLAILCWLRACSCFWATFGGFWGAKSISASNSDLLAYKHGSRFLQGLLPGSRSPVLLVYGVCI